MNTPPAKIFRAYDVRGTTDGPNASLTQDSVRLIGQAFGSHLHDGKLGATVVVGHDTRASSAGLAAALIDGLTSTGCNVVDIGMCPTPVSYWYATSNGNLPRAMITGSHLEASKNGVKFSIGSEPIYGDAIQGFYQRIQLQDFIHQQAGTPTTVAPLNGYVQDILSRVTMTKPLRVVLECYRGATALVAEQLFTTLGCEVVACLHCEVDGTFSTHQPNPQATENLADLIAAVKQHNADLGIAFDGDGDRVGVVDNQGNVIDADRLLVLLAQDILQRHAGAAVVVDVSGSKIVADEVKRLGGTTHMARNGHPFIKAKLNETSALIGGEVSGHIFIADNYYGFDDGLFAAARIVETLAKANSTMSAIDATIPRLHSTPVYRPHCPPELTPQVIASIKDQLSANAETITDIDGLRLDFENGWGLIRPSNTEPVLSMRFEGNTKADAIAYRDAFFDIIATYPDIDLSAYRD